MNQLEISFNRVRQKMAELDAILSSLTTGQISSFFDPISVEVTFASPEAAYLRLNSFFYIATHEGRTKINYDFLIDKLEVNGTDGNRAKEFKKMCHNERTKLQHNLDTSRRSNEIRYACEDWHEKACGHKEPNSEDDWKNCYEALNVEAIMVFDSFQTVIARILDSRDEYAPIVIADWKQKLDNYYPLYLFIEIANKVAFNMGYEWLDLKRFCNQYYNSWKSQIADSADFNFDDLAHKLIQRDLHEVIEKKRLPLPFTTEDFIQELGIPASPKIKSVLSKAQELYLAKPYAKEDLMKELRVYFNSN